MTVRKKTGGRKAGTPNKVTTEVKEIARAYTQQAVQTLVAVMQKSANDQARIAAAKELLDRGHGKCPSAAISDKSPAFAASDIPSLPEYEAAVRKVLAEY